MSLKVKQKIPLKIKRMGINGEGIGFSRKPLFLFQEPSRVKISSAKLQVSRKILRKPNSYLWIKRLSIGWHPCVISMRPVGAVKSCIWSMTSSWSLKQIRVWLPQIFLDTCNLAEDIFTLEGSWNKTRVFWKIRYLPRLSPYAWFLMEFFVWL